MKKLNYEHMKGKQWVNLLKAAQMIKDKAEPGSPVAESALEDVARSLVHVLNKERTKNN